MAVYDKDKMLIWFTPKDPNSRAWNIDLAKFIPNNTFVPVNHATANSSIKNTTDAERVAYCHACFGYPPVSTFMIAVRNGWIYNFEPSVTTRMITQNIPVSKHTGFGFLDQTPSHVKPTSNQDLDELEIKLSNEPEEDNEIITNEEHAHIQIEKASDFLSSSDFCSLI